jgi:hypothetical protein
LLGFAQEEGSFAALRMTAKGNCEGNINCNGNGDSHSNGGCGVGCYVNGGGNSDCRRRLLAAA